MELRHNHIPLVNWLNLNDREAGMNVAHIYLVISALAMIGALVFIAVQLFLVPNQKQR